MTKFITQSLCCLILFAPAVQAIDTVYKKSDGDGVGGTITSITKTEVVVTQKVGNKEITVPANDIESIQWDAEPPVLGLARSNERSGNLDEALAGLNEAKGATEDNRIQAEIDFLLARTASKIAQKDTQQLPTAIEQLKTYTGKNRDYFRFYDAQMLLGETALLAKDTVTAEAAFTLIEQSPWQDYKMAAQLGNAKSLLIQDNVSGAKAIFDKVASVNPKTGAEKSRRLEAIIGQASCEQKSSNFDAAIKSLDQVIHETAPEDTRLLAQAYLEMGACHAADPNKVKEAVLAYLHVDVIPSLAENSDLHAEALYHLAKLWPTAGQPARGAEASAKLEQDYPNSPWTKKLQTGS